MSMQNELPNRSGNRGLFPLDLRTWFEDRELAGLALEAVQVVDFPPALLRQQANAGHSAPMMTTVLVYSYGTGSFDSREIEWRISSDATLRYLCANRYPGWNDLRRHRRQSGPRIEQALRTLLRLAWARRSIAADAGPLLESDLAAEAHARLQRAVRCDSMAMDE